MREELDQWLFVYGTYALAIAATLGLVVWAWLTMRTAEKRRDKGRDKGRGQDHGQNGGRSQER